MKNIFIRATFLLLLTACSNPANELILDDISETQQEKPIQISGDSFSIKPGQSINNTSHNLLLSLISINDTRCPQDVQCIWAGEVTAYLSVQTELPPRQSKELALCLGCSSGPDDSLHFELGNQKFLLVLKDVLPYPKFQQQESSENKLAEFSLEIVK